MDDAKREGQLLKAIRAGDRRALAAVFDRYADRLYRLAYGVLRDRAEAEDVVQESFLALIDRIDTFEGRSRVSTWLYRVAYNRSIDRVRERRRASPGVDDDAAVPMPRSLADWSKQPDEILVDREARDMLERAIGDLPERLRAVFVLRDVEGLSTAETADVLGITTAATKVRLHRARLQLRERLADYFGRTPTSGEDP